MDALDPAEFLEAFCTEAAEHLASMDDRLLEAERLARAGQGLPDELVNGLFRAMHTLKGMAGMMDFAATTRLAHLMEQVFDDVRQGRRRLTAGELAVTFQGVDALKALHARIGESGGEAGCEVEEALAALTSLASGPQGSAEGRINFLELLDPHDQMAALVQVAKGVHLYQLAADPARHCPDGLASWLEGLGLIGRVLGVWSPEGRPLDASASGPLRVLLLSEADRVSLLDCAGLPPGAVEQPDLPWAQPAAPAEPAVQAPARELHASAPERATTIRVETARLDRLMELMGELVIHQTRLARLSGELGQVLEGPGSLEERRGTLQALSGGLEEAMQALGWVSGALQESTMRVRMVAVGTLFQRFPRIVRDLARECGKSARLELVGADTELDKTVIEQIGDPLIHLIRNAVDHGLERPADRLSAGKPAEGTITLAAAQQGHQIVISIADDGRGIDRDRVLAKAREQGLVAEGESLPDAEVLNLVFRPGFSTARAVTNLSGRGVGLDVVQANILSLGGSVQVLSVPGSGTRFVIKLPLTLAIAKALLVVAGGHTFAIPLSAVEETLRVRPEAIRTLQGRAMIRVREAVLPIFRLSELFGFPTAETGHAALSAVVVGNGDERLGLVVETLVGQQDVVVKSLGEFLGHPPGIGGATILGDGRVALIVDIPTLLARQTAGALVSQGA